MKTKIQVTEEQLNEMDESYGGFCLACGEEAYGVEPDACNYKCESCSERQVFGIGELAIIGKLEIVD